MRLKPLSFNQSIGTLIVLIVAVTATLALIGGAFRGDYQAVVRQGDQRWYAKGVGQPDEHGCIILIDMNNKPVKICGNYSVSVK